MTIMPPDARWLPFHLQTLFPIDALLHVGAGAGQSIDQYRQQNVPAAVLVDADSDRVEELRAATADNSRYLAACAVIAGGSAVLPFFGASAQEGNGAKEPKHLATTWRRSVTLEAFLKSPACSALSPATINWVVVDCLPALPIIKGAGAFLDEWDVVVARVVLDPETAGNNPEIGAAALDAFMAEQCFRVYSVQPERRPGFGHVTYARDWKTKLAGANADNHAREAEKNLRDAEKRLALAHADLDHLRAQFSELSGRHDQGQALLRQIKAKLLHPSASRPEVNSTGQTSAKTSD